MQSLRETWLRRLDSSRLRGHASCQVLPVVTKPTRHLPGSIEWNINTFVFLNPPTCGSFRFGASWYDSQVSPRALESATPRPAHNGDQSALSRHHCAFITRSRNPANSPVAPKQQTRAPTLGPRIILSMARNCFQPHVNAASNTKLIFLSFPSLFFSFRLSYFISVLFPPPHCLHFLFR